MATTTSTRELQADTTTVAISTRHTAVAQVLTQVVRFATNVVLARMLGPHDFGVVAVALVIMTILDQFKDFGTGSAIIQRPTLDAPLLDSIFALNLAMGFLESGLMYALAGPLAAAFGDRGATPTVQAFAGITLVTSFGLVHQCLLRRGMDFRSVALINIVMATVTAAASIAAAVAGTTYWALVIGNAAGALVGTVMLWCFDPWRPTGQLRLASLRSIWAFSWQTFLSNLLYFLWSQSDKMVVSRFLGGGPLGGYTLGQRFVAMPTGAINSVIGEVTYSAFASRQDDDEALRSGFTRAGSVIALVTFPLLFGVAAVAAPMVPVVFGDKWHGLVPVVCVLAPVGAVQATTMNCGQLLLAKGRSDWSFRWGLLYLVVLGGSELIGVRWGLVGVACGFAAGTLVLAPLSLRLALGLVGGSVGPYLRALTPYIGLSVVMAAAVVALVASLSHLGVPQPVQLVAGVALGAVVYLCPLALLRPPAVRDALAVLLRRH